MKKKFTLAIYTANKSGMLNQVTIIFTRRNLNIESITVSKSEIENVHRYTIVIIDNEERVRKLVKQIEKQVEVHKAFYYTDEEIVSHEFALFKLPTQSFTQANAEDILRGYEAKILAITEEYIVVEKSGYAEEIDEFYKALEPYNILEYCSSGRVAISKRMKPLKSYLEELGTIEDYSLNL